MRTTSRRSERRLLFTAILFADVQFGMGHLLHLLSNSLCFPYLGCNVGFFGFDALIHVVGGAFLTTLMLWLGERYEKLNFPEKDVWKTILVLLAIIALVGVIWEIWEFAVDHFRMLVLHENLIYPINRLNQATNSDTMGDLTFNFVGALIAIAVIAIFDKHALTRKKTE
jgi:hypothetical protein